MNTEAGFQLSDIQGIVKRRAGVAGLTALAVALAGYWIAMALPNVYRSFATVLVEPQAVAEVLVRAGVAESDLNERLHLMTAEILSRPRLSRIIDELELYTDESEYMLREEVIDRMKERIQVDPVVSDLERRQGRRMVAATDINEFRISFEDYEPAIARDVAQRLANDFIETHIENRVQLTRKSLEFIDAELERLAERIRSVEGEIAAVKNENPGKLPEDMSANQRRLERALSDLAVAQRTLATAASDEAFYRSQLAAAAAYSAPNDDASPVRRLELLKLQLAQYRSLGYTEKHPDIEATKAEIEEVEASIAAALEDDESSTAGATSIVEQQAEAEMRRAALRRAATVEEIERLRELAAQIQTLITLTPAVAEQLDALNREYEHLFSSFQDFSNRQLEASVQAQLERRQLGEQFRVLEAAFIATGPSAPNRPLIMLLGIFLGVAAGGGIALLLEVMDTSIHDARQLQSQLQVPVLAAIPRIWLESDRVALRRKRIRSAFATVALTGFAVVGGAANYLWVNGAPRFLSVAFEGEVEGADAQTGTGGEQ
jgi:polysaccharide chain length determinant protein (PEP-CTERM system associated)